MRLENISIDERLLMAIESKDEKILLELMQDNAMIVRRAVARNTTTPTKILNRLAFDQAVNVVYHALNNENCTIVRKLRDISHPCVTCDIRGDRMNCAQCDKVDNCMLQVS